MTLELNRIYCQDCIDGMADIPDKSVDLVLTDPPYNISTENNFTTMGRSGIDFGAWDKDADILTYIESLPRIVKPSGTVIIFNAWRNLSAIADKLEDCGFIVKDVFRWIKTNPMPRNRDRRYITDYEFALVAVGKGKWTFNRLNSSYERPEYHCSVPSGSIRKHPTQKPVELMEHLINVHSKEGGTVLDCFMGSGTTAVACQNTGRNFIGFETDEQYYKIAQERIGVITDDNSRLS